MAAELVDAFKELIPNLSPQQVNKLEQKGIPDIVEMSTEVFTTALFLVAGYPAKAAEYADLHGVSVPWEEQETGCRTDGKMKMIWHFGVGA